MTAIEPCQQHRTRGWRRLVLEPLMALAPNLAHPVLKVSLAQLLAALTARME